MKLTRDEVRSVVREVGLWVVLERMDEVGSVVREVGLRLILIVVRVDEVLQNN